VVITTKDYVGAVTGETERALGNDAFDVEIWNELSFGSEFLDAATYYDPAPPGDGDAKREILERTVRWLRDPEHGVENVRIGDGFANQTPFAAGSTSPPGLSAIDKHPYPRPREFLRRRTPSSRRSTLGESRTAVSSRRATAPSFPSTTSPRSRPSTWAATSRRSRPTSKG